MAERPKRQEQERAGDDVVEVAPGILRAQLPIDMPGLGHTNCYVIEDERGVAVVDPGLPGKATLEALRRRLASAGIPLKRVHTVVITHSHPDHFGGAGWIRRETGAAIVTHRKFTFLWDRFDPPDVDVEDAVVASTPEGAAPVGTLRRPWDPPPWGGEGYSFSRGRRLRMEGMRRFPRFFRTPTPTQRLDDADHIRLGGREWIAIHTPGHTDDHLCLYDPEGEVMLSGDHVLPTITPHIGGMSPVGDPLDDFFSSLDKVAAYGPTVRTVLPAHGHPFDDLAGRAKSIQEHHVERLDLLRRSLDEHGRPARVQEMSTHLFSARAQGAMADSETYAHLEHLRRAGELRRLERADGYEYVRD
jgi:glyoxylase-like metal-dependent hydrolase (beta-lactamase superfamily II)